MPNPGPVRERQPRTFRVACKNCAAMQYIYGMVDVHVFNPHKPPGLARLDLSGPFCFFGEEVTPQTVQELRELYFEESIRLYYGRGQRRILYEFDCPQSLCPVPPKGRCPMFELRADYRKRRLKRLLSQISDPDEV